MIQTALLAPLNVDRAPRYREAAYTAIKFAILDGRFAPNQSLVEEQIAAMLQISRTPVREALAILEHEGLIAPRQGRGLYVATLTRDEFVAMFVANETVEPYLVRRAALQASLEQLEALNQAIRRAQEAVTAIDMVGFLRASRDFHRLLGEASGNAPLTRFVVQNEERTDIYLIGSGQRIEPANMEASIHEHGAILDALIQRDPESAARLAIYHAQSLRQRFAELFRS